MDVNELLPAIPDGSVAAYYVFYPDPWPKKRHQKRRFFRASNIDHLMRTLDPGGELHAATDHTEYWEQISSLLDGNAGFERLDTFGGEHFPAPLDRPLTNFEAKYLVDGRDRFRASWRRRQRA
jgi:tRNA (guanine-N7-)-methyltransferase